MSSETGLTLRRENRESLINNDTFYPMGRVRSVSQTQLMSFLGSWLSEASVRGSQILLPSLACVLAESAQGISQISPCFQEKIIAGKHLHPCKSPLTIDRAVLYSSAAWKALVNETVTFGKAGVSEWLMKSPSIKECDRNWLDWEVK